MPLPVPNLDDRRYSDLVEEARSMIPRYAPEWTNHNPSDPGITLIELLAYFTEMLIYRLNRVTRETKLAFLRLLQGPDQDEPDRLANASMAEIDEALRLAVLALRSPQRAVTRSDYEYLARRLTAENPVTQRVMRARCFPQSNLDRGEPTSVASQHPGHISVVVVPNTDLGPQEMQTLVDDVQRKLEPMRLLTTRLHVVRPQYLWVTLSAVIQTRPNVSLADVRSDAIKVLTDYFSPFTGGGPTRDGWPFGRAVYLSEVYEQLEHIAGVDYVRDVRVLHLSGTESGLDSAQTAVGIQIGVRSTVGVDSRLGGDTAAAAERLLRDASGTLIAVTLRSHELVRVVVRAEDLLPATPPVSGGS